MGIDVSTTQILCNKIVKQTILTHRSMVCHTFDCQIRLQFLVGTSRPLSVHTLYVDAGNNYTRTCLVPLCDAHYHNA